MAEHVQTSGFNIPQPPPGAANSAPPAVAPPPTQHAIGLPGHTPGHVPPSLDVQLASDPRYADYVAWKKEQEAQGAKPAVEADPNAKPEEDQGNAPITDPAALLELVDNASQSDPVLAAQLSMLTRAAPKLDLQRAIGNALIYSDSKLVDIAYIKEIAGDASGDITVLAKSLVEYSLDAANKAVENVYSAAGGEKQWAAASAAFNKSAPQHLKVVVSNLMNSGDAANINAAAKTVVDFAKASGSVPNVSGNLVQTGAAAPAAAQALGKAAFQTELYKLDPNSSDYNARRNDLFARRQLGKQLNLQ